ncbi:Leucine-rich repeat serine/threonine-protein kinase 2 [Mactra antiquata]
MFKIFLLLLMTALSAAQTARPFDRDHDCPAQTIGGKVHECRCEPNIIECHGRGITTFPHFARTGYVFQSIDLDTNGLTTIPALAFNDINVTDIILSNNEIDTIDDRAFVSLERQLRFLDLRQNNLTHLPDFFDKFVNLSIFDVSYNPIAPENFTENVMRELGDYVTEFRFGDPSLTGWPTNLHHLPRLEILKFYGGTMERIPITAFSGFEWPLRKLWIQNTNLISTPIALQDLKSINEFHFDNNPSVGDAGILIPAFAGLSGTLETLSLENNSLTTFPSVLLTLHNIHNLSLARNNLQFVSDEAVAVVNSNLTILNLQACNLDRIPGALSRLRHLEYLDFSYNNITSIEKNDLQLMHNLRTLIVSYNPLQYISNSTFYDLTSLRRLILQETGLFSVPEAIVKLPNLQTIDLRDKESDIECNCDLGWLYCFTKRSTGLNILGDCYTIVMTIQDYAENQIPKTCPIIC